MKLIMHITQLPSALPGRSSQALSGWMGAFCELPSSGLSTGVLGGLSLDFGGATQGQSKTPPEG